MAILQSIQMRNLKRVIDETLDGGKFRICCNKICSIWGNSDTEASSHVIEDGSHILSCFDIERLSFFSSFQA